MSIGSAPEIGATFSRLGDYPTYDSLVEWHRTWRKHVGDDLLGGYARLGHPDPERRRFYLEMHWAFV